MEKTSSLFYVLPEGSTQEEELSWEQLKSRVKDGILSLNSFVFERGTKKWKKIRELDEFKDLESFIVDAAQESQEEAAISMPSGEKDKEYADILKELQERGGSFDLLARAARTALNIGKKDEAKSYYQRALELKPFHPRIAREIRNGFPPSEQGNFRLLGRKNPWWNDAVEAITRPFEGDWMRFAVLSLVFGALLFSQLNMGIFFIIALILEIELIRRHDSPDGILPLNSELPRTLLECLKPFLKSVAVWIECVAPFLILASILSILGEGTQFDPFGAVERSPVMVVLIYTISLAYMPAVWIMSANQRSKLQAMLNPSNVISAIKLMEAEYFVTAVFLGVASLFWVTLQGLLSFIPVFGEILTAALAVYFIWLSGFAFGRLLSRYRHVFSSAGEPGITQTQEVL